MPKAQKAEINRKYAILALEWKKIQIGRRYDEICNDAKKEYDARMRELNAKIEALAVG